MRGWVSWGGEGLTWAHSRFGKSLPFPDGQVFTMAAWKCFFPHSSRSLQTVTDDMW